MKHLLRLSLFAILALSLATGYAQTIYSYTNDSAGHYNSVAANATGVNLTRNNGTNRPGTPCLTGYSSSAFSTTATYSTSLGAIEAQVTPNSGYQLLVSGFTADLRRSNTGPANVRLAYSTDGGFTWIDKGSDDSPNNAGCGTTTTATWNTGFTVSGVLPLQFRVYGFNASNVSGTLQILNMQIFGIVNSSYSITTSAASFGPFCQGVNHTISLPFTNTGTFTGSYYVQLSDASGVFPANSSSNIISTGTTTSPASATIPSSTAAGTGYRVRVVNQNPDYYTSGNNGSDIVINPVVVPSVTIVDSPTAVCAGSPIVFSVSASANAGTSPTYQWYVNAGATSTASTYSSSTLTNSDSVHLVITSNAACASPASASSNMIHVTVYSPQTTSLHDTLCPGGSVVFGGNTQTTSGNYTAHLSTVNGCDSAITLHLVVLDTKRDTITANICQGNSYSYNGTTYAAGVYHDTLTCDHILTLNVIAHPKPTAVATLTGTSQLSTTSFATYQWLLNGSTIANATAQNYTAVQNGNYSVIITDINGCTDTSAAVSVVSLGVNQTNTLDARIYPSPTEGIINIDAEGLNSVEVTDMIGRTILSTPVSKNNYHTQVDLSGYTSGIYVVILHGADNAVSIKSISKQ